MNRLRQHLLKLTAALVLTAMSAAATLAQTQSPPQPALPETSLLLKLIGFILWLFGY